MRTESMTEASPASYPSAEPQRQPGDPSVGRYHAIVFEGAARSRPAREKRTAARTAHDLALRLPRHVADELISADDVRFLQRVFELGSLDLSKYRLAPLSRRIPACLRALKASSLPRALAAIEADASLLRTAMNTLLIGVTEFFRDPPVFDFLRERALPALADRSARVWSVGCSSGAELYSVAMLLQSRRALEGSQLLGTDYRPAAINAARAGAYSDEAVAALPAEILSSNFSQQKESWLVDPTLRNATQWRVSDVFTDPAPGTWDMILCRNVAIYLDSAASAVLWQKLFDALNAGGFLVVGRADRPRIHGLERMAPCVYRKQ
jgi:chemotaxis methyl-accepting protein methylase